MLQTAASDPQATTSIMKRDPGDLNGFIPTLLAGDYANRGTWLPQKFGQQFYAGFIGPAFHGGRGNCDFQGISNLPDDAIPSRSWLDLHVKSDSLTAFQNHGHIIS